MAEEHREGEEHHKGGIAFYFIVALILMGVTYLEFALVEYEVAWLTGVTTLILLVALSVLKFLLVVALYMHLRDDDPIYTGFFSTGIVIAIGTFVALSFLFTTRGMISAVGVHAREAQDVIEGEALPERGLKDLEVLLAEERPLLESYRVPVPKRQGVRLPLPAAPAPVYTLRAAGALPAPDTGGAAQPAGEATQASAQASTFDWQELGTTTFNGNCAACHQQNGQGVAGAFPPLAGHIDQLYNAEGGRKYILNVVLYGLQGEIDVLGQSYNSVMQPWSQLSNEQIAATLNHELTSWGNDKLEQNFSPILPDEVQAERSNNLSSSQVLELRPKLP